MEAHTISDNAVAEEEEGVNADATDVVKVGGRKEEEEEKDLIEEELSGVQSQPTTAVPSRNAAEPHMVCVDTDSAHRFIDHGYLFWVTYIFHTTPFLTPPYPSHH